MNLVLFLGAGFSRPFGQPTMKEFLGYADGCKRLDDEERKFLGELVLEARRANAFLESSTTNLEDILSFFEMRQRLGLGRERGDQSDRLKRILGKVYTDTKNPKDFWSRYKVLNRLLGVGRLAEYQGALSFITTNYDLNLECALRALGANADPGFAVKRVANSDGGLYNQAGFNFPLYKLHGSANWYESTEQGGVQVEDRIVNINTFGPDVNRELPYVCCSDYTPAGAPLIIAPSFLKPDLPPPLGTTWAKAAQALAGAHFIAFIGYSFPNSDTEMMYFLATALAENATIRQILLLDVQADRLVERLRGSTSRLGSQFRDLLVPIAGDWSTQRASPLSGIRDKI